jgi:hypothetical protein
VAAGAGAGGAAPPLAEDAAAGTGGATGGGVSKSAAKVMRRQAAALTHQVREVDVAHGVAEKAAVPGLVWAASDAMGGGAGAGAALDAA